jgi:hypothetical protein
MRLRVSQYAHVHTTDFDHARVLNAKEFDRIVNVCVTRATEALATPAAGYTQLQCAHIADIFNSMSATHRTIRRLLDHEAPIDPETVDTLALVRLQVEGLYAVCLMLEGPEHVTAYMQDYWRKKYVRHLLYREETKLLPLGQEFYRSMEPLRQVILLGNELGITAAQRFTVDKEELGVPLPQGFVEEKLPEFPTPGRAIRQIKSSPEKMRMLQRLYAKYVDLCSFAHGLAQANLLKIMFNNRSPLQKLSSDAAIKKRYEQDVVREAYLTSFFSIAQCTAELTTLYPLNIDIVEAASRAWSQLSIASFLTKAIWEIRTQKLLGALA